MSQNYAPGCEICEEHPDLIAKSREALPNVETLYDLSDFFKIFGDSTRLGILFAIDKAPMCVCDISAALGMTKSAVSHQLKITVVVEACPAVNLYLYVEICIV